MGEARNFSNFLSRLLLRIMTEEEERWLRFPHREKSERKMFIFQFLLLGFLFGENSRGVDGRDHSQNDAHRSIEAKKKER